jgi:tetraacyldisaccharide-1-P 4'-kinase
MWPQTFFDQMRNRPEGTEIAFELALPDHGSLDDSSMARLLENGGDRGIVCTLKDVARLVDRFGDRVPVWYVTESVVWQGDDENPAPLRAALSLVRTSGRK